MSLFNKAFAINRYDGTIPMDSSSSGALSGISSGYPRFFHFSTYSETFKIIP